MLLLYLMNYLNDITGLTYLVWLTCIWRKIVIELTIIKFKSEKIISKKAYIKGKTIQNITAVIGLVFMIQPLQSPL
jgi:hypothetical protein